MEHRLYPRRDFAFDLIVRRDGQPPALCRSCNVSAEGAFVAMGAGQLDIKVGDAVELDLRRACAPKTRVPKVHALVIHRGERGAGLLFSTPDPFACTEQTALSPRRA